MSDFRIDIRTDLVYGDVSLKTGSTSVNDNNVDIFNIGAGLSLTFTNDAIGAMNAARPSTRRGPTLSQGSRSPRNRTEDGRRRPARGQRSRTQQRSTHNVVDADVTIDDKFSGDLGVFNLGVGGQSTLISTAAAALVSTFALGSTLISMAAPHPFEVTHTEAARSGRSRRTGT